MRTSLFVILVAGLLTASAACRSGSSKDNVTNTSADNPQQVTALIKRDTAVGSGAEAVPGRRVSVHYTGWLYVRSAEQGRGKQFDSSVGGEPFEFTLGARQVIPGWDEGVAGMKVGGKRTLIIPSNMGYGAQGAGSDIPPNAALQFDVELLAVR